MIGITCAALGYGLGGLGEMGTETDRLYMSIMSSASPSAAAIFSAEEGWARAPPNMNDIFGVGGWPLVIPLLTRECGKRGGNFHCSLLVGILDRGGDWK